MKYIHNQSNNSVKKHGCFQLLQKVYILHINSFKNVFKNKQVPYSTQHDINYPIAMLFWVHLKINFYQYANENLIHFKMSP